MDPTVFNNNKRWDNYKCSCACKELIDIGKYDDGFIWNASTCECKCNKSCDVGEYLDYVSCKCRKRLIDKLALECENERLNTTDTI